MNITLLSLKNFRNYKEADLIFSEKMNIFYGNNAQGKTNLIESLYIVGSGDSFKKVENEKIIKFGENFSMIYAELIKNQLQKKILFGFNINDKHINVNDKKIKKRSEYIGTFNVTLFSPEDLMIIKNDGSYRRKFLDLILCNTDKVYLKELLDYYKILRNRNIILKEIRNNYQRKSILEIWDEQLAKYAVKIVQKRLEILNFFSNKSKEIHYKTNLEENIDLKYIDTIYCGKEIDLADYEKAFKNNQKRVQKEEIGRGITLNGPHRDDIEIKINNLNSRYFGSQGQQRSIAITLRLTEVEYIYSLFSEYPIILLDDVFSELDDNRRSYLMKYLDKNAQLFLTSTRLSDFEELKSNSKIFFISNGQVKEDYHENEKQK